MSKQFLWTVEAVAKAKKLYDEGYSCGEIGDRIGCSRNAVIGKVHRMKWPLRGPSKMPTGKRRKQVLARRKNAAEERAKKQFAIRTRRATPAEQAAAKLSFDSEVKRLEAIPDVGTMKLLDLTETACRYPIGDPTSPGFLFCGSEKVHGHSYCLKHLIRCQPSASVVRAMASSVAQGGKTRVDPHVGSQEVKEDAHEPNLEPAE